MLTFGSVLLLAAMFLQVCSGYTIRVGSEAANDADRPHSKFHPVRQDYNSTLGSNLDSLVCQPGTYYTDGKCLPLGPNCHTYNNKRQCLSCPYYTELVMGRCLPIQPKVVTCLEGGHGRCKKCAPLTNNSAPGHCKQIQQNCLLFSDEGVCLWCKGSMVIFNNICYSRYPMPTYYLDKHCQVWRKGFCLTCESGWQLSRKGQPCEPKEVKWPMF